MARLAPFLALYALLLATLGPVLDHHFAERQPDHQHVYLGNTNPAHQHPYQAAHIHRHEPAGGGPQPESSSALPEDTLYLTDSQGIGQAVDTLATPWRYTYLFLPDTGDNPLYNSTSPDRPLAERSVAPLERPPLV